MKTSVQLRSDLAAINRKSYPAYKSLKGEYQFADYILSIDHVQGDPFAAPSHVSVLLNAEKCGFPADYLKGKRTLKVLAPEGFAAKSSREEFMRYAKENPDLDLIYREARNDDIPGKLDRGEAEIGFVRGITFPGMQKECIIKT